MKHDGDDQHSQLVVCAGGLLGILLVHTVYFKGLLGGQIQFLGLEHFPSAVLKTTAVAHVAMLI